MLTYLGNNVDRWKTDTVFTLLIMLELILFIIFFVTLMFIRELNIVVSQIIYAFNFIRVYYIRSLSLQTSTYAIAKKLELSRIFDYIESISRTSACRDGRHRILEDISQQTVDIIRQRVQLNINLVSKDFSINQELILQIPRKDKEDNGFSPILLAPEETLEGVGILKNRFQLYAQQDTDRRVEQGGKYIEADEEYVTILLISREELYDSTSVSEKNIYFGAKVFNKESSYDFIKNELNCFKKELGYIKKIIKYIKKQRAYKVIFNKIIDRNDTTFRSVTEFVSSSSSGVKIDTFRDAFGQKINLEDTSRQTVNAGTRQRIVDSEWVPETSCDLGFKVQELQQCNSIELDTISVTDIHIEHKLQKTQHRKKQNEIKQLPGKDKKDNEFVSTTLEPIEKLKNEFKSIFKKYLNERIDGIYNQCLSLEKYFDENKKFFCEEIENVNQSSIKKYEGKLHTKECRTKGIKERNENIKKKLEGDSKSVDAFLIKNINNPYYKNIYEDWLLCKKEINSMIEKLVKFWKELSLEENTEEFFKKNNNRYPVRLLYVAEENSLNTKKYLEYLKSEINKSHESEIIYIINDLLKDKYILSNSFKIENFLPVANGIIDDILSAEEKNIENIKTRINGIYDTLENDNKYINKHNDYLKRICNLKSMMCYHNDRFEQECKIEEELLRANEIFTSWVIVHTNR